MPIRGCSHAEQTRARKQTRTPWSLFVLVNLARERAAEALRLKLLEAMRAGGVKKDRGWTNRGAAFGSDA